MMPCLQHLVAQMQLGPKAELTELLCVHKNHHGTALAMQMAMHKSQCSLLRRTLASAGMNVYTNNTNNHPGMPCTIMTEINSCAPLIIRLDVQK